MIGVIGLKKIKIFGKYKEDFHSSKFHHENKVQECHQLKSAHPLGKSTSQRLPEDDPEKYRDVLRTSPYSPLCNTKGRILSEASLGCTQDDNLTIIHKIAFYRIFFIFCDSVILILYQALYSQRRLKT